MLNVPGTCRIQIHLYVLTDKYMSLTRLLLFEYSCTAAISTELQSCAQSKCSAAVRVVSV